MRGFPMGDGWRGASSPWVPGGVAWDDPAIGADWDVADPQLSERDRANPLRVDLAVDMIPAFKDPVSGAGERA